MPLTIKCQCRQESAAAMSSNRIVRYRPYMTAKVFRPASMTVLPGRPRSARSGQAHAAPPGPASLPAPASRPHARPARRAGDRPSSEATAAAASAAPRWTAAWRNYAASASAVPRAQRSAPAPLPARPAPLPVPRAARPPARPAPHRRNQRHHQAHPDVTTTRDRSHTDPPPSSYRSGPRKCDGD
jgi:hypothetical protein